MLFFRNDYGQGCIPEILEALAKANDEAHPGYGLDNYNKMAAELLAAQIGTPSCDIHFMVSGTLTNLTAIRHILRPYEGIIAAETAHINVHETGAVEATGHKILITPSLNGKVDLNRARAILKESQEMGEHVVKPRAVYISDSTELGTVYTRKELEDLSGFCKENNLYLIMDGARLGAALEAGVDYTLKDLPGWCDLFTIGGTKNGALFGEAVIISNPAIKENFRYVMKQSGALLPKGWLLGLQFNALFKDGAYFRNAKKANEMAAEIQKSVVEFGYPLYTRSQTNQVFLVVTPEQYDYLAKEVDFEIWDYRESNIVIRLVTSWHTSRNEIRDLKVVLKKAMDLTSKAAEKAQKPADSQKESRES